MKRPKEHIITFKADQELAEQLQAIPNRSQFIRSALRKAMAETCPLCKGSGILSPEQRTHLDDFLINHVLEECHRCNALHLVCKSSIEQDIH